MPLFDQRSGFNLNPVESEANYAFIDHLLPAGMSPVGIAWATTVKTFMQCLDQTTEMPNDNTAQSFAFGGAILIPDANDFAGPYIIDWTGDAQVNFDVGAPLTLNSSSNVTASGFNTIFTTTDPTQPSSVNISLPTGSFGGVGVTLKGIKVLANFGGSGIFPTKPRFYRAADQTRLNSGKMFRVPWLQTIADLNPSFIRFLNWVQWQNPICRFEHLGSPVKASGGAWTVSPPYGDTSGSNTITLTAVSTGTNQTPVSMTHGEIVTCRMGSAMTRAGVASPTAITNANPGVVTTSAAHGFNTGDVIIHGLNGSMPKLDHFPVTITKIDATHYSIGVDTTTFGSFAVIGSPYAGQYVTLNVGGRGAYPIIFRTQLTPVSIGDYHGASQGSAQIAVGDYKTFYFDKDLGGKTDGTGAWVKGCWLMTIDTFANNPAECGRPIEHMVQFTNEVNEIAVAAGRAPSGAWIHLPGRALMTSTDADLDPDYASASDLPVNLVDTCINGANGFDGLQNGATLWIEYGNETWNTPSFPSTYLAARGGQRYNTVLTDITDYYLVRSVIAMRSIAAAFPGANINTVLGGQAGFGMSGGGTNDLRINGSTLYNSDAANTWGTAPMAEHDCFAVAAYFDPPTTYTGGVGTGSFTDDSAMYAGTSPYSSPDQNQAIVNFVAQVKTNNGIGIEIDYYLSDALTGVMSDYGAAVLPYGKKCVQYEGGLQWFTSPGQALEGNHTITSADSTFLFAISGSTQWRDAQLGFFDNCALVDGLCTPSVLLPMCHSPDTFPLDQRWAYAHPDNYFGGVEGDNLKQNATWVGMGVRNQLLGGALSLDDVLDDGTIAVAYSDFVTATGGTAPYTYAVTSGSLPTSLSLNASTGEISGTPTVAGTYSFTIEVTDDAAVTSDRSYSVIIHAVVALNDILPDGTDGVAYSSSVTASGGAGPYTYVVVSGALPTGLSLNSGSGAVTGTPSPAATYNFTIRAVDANSDNVSRAYSVIIAAAVVASSAPPLYGAPGGGLNEPKKKKTPEPGQPIPLSSLDPVAPPEPPPIQVEVPTAPTVIMTDAEKAQIAQSVAAKTAQKHRNLMDELIMFFEHLFHIK
jgi:hypothetical protein